MDEIKNEIPYLEIVGKILDDVSMVSIPFHKADHYHLEPDKCLVDSDKFW